LCNYFFQQRKLALNLPRQLVVFPLFTKEVFHQKVFCHLENGRFGQNHKSGLIPFREGRKRRGYGVDSEMNYHHVFT